MNSSQFCKDKFLRSIFSLTLLAVMLGTPVCGSAFDIRILDPPRDNHEVNRWVPLSGVAFLPHGYHLWVLVSYGRSRDLWWPIAEARIDPQSRKWSLSVPLGGPEDLGQFRIAVGPVDENEHRRLENFLRQSGGKGESGPQPIMMPRFSSSPMYRTVIKKWHR